MPSGIHCHSCAWSYLWACFFCCCPGTAWKQLLVTIRYDCHRNMWAWAIVIFIFPPGTLHHYHPKHGAPSGAGEGPARLHESPKLTMSQQRAPKKDQVPLYLLCSTHCKYFIWNHKLEVGSISAIPCFSQKNTCRVSKSVTFCELDFK